MDKDRWYKNIVGQFGWLIIMTAALTMSAYSLYYIARSWGVPIPFALLSSAAFDGIAVTSADYSLRYARIGQTALGPRLATILFACLSAWINSTHAVIGHEIGIARIFWAAPPIGALLVYTFHIKWQRRRALANAGRIAPDLPTFGAWAWALFPVKTWRIARTIVRYRLGLLLARQTPGMIHGNPPVPVPDSGDSSPGSEGTGVSFSGIPERFPGNSERFATYGKLPAAQPKPNPQTVKAAREWARAFGYVVSDRGPLSADIMRDYEEFIRPMPTQTSPPESSPETPEDSPETPESSPEIPAAITQPLPELKELPPVNGYEKIRSENTS